MRKVDLKQVLSKHGDFSKLPDEVFDFLANHGSPYSLDKGEVFFKEGDHDQRLIIIVKGCLDAYRESKNGIKKFLRRIGEGELVGITSFFTNGMRSATVEAASVQTNLWAIDFPVLQKYMYPEHSHGQELSQALTSILSQKVRKKNLEIASSSKSPEKRSIKVAFFDSQPYMEKSFLKYAGEDIDYTFIQVRLSAETARLAEGYEIICSFVNDKIDESAVEVLYQCGVRMIALRCAGFNHVELEACIKRGISVARVPAYSPYAVAEHATAMLMCLNRRLHKAYSRVREGNFTLDGLVGFDIHGKTVGVIGTGKIGKVFANHMHGFGAKVLAYDIAPDQDLINKEVVSYTNLDEVFSNADIISLHTPLLAETLHLIDAKAISKMKPGVFILNTSRGGLIDTRALIVGLKEKKIGGAALDVYEEESEYFFQDKSAEVITDDVLARLLTFNNVLVTSHQGFLTKDALKAIAEVTIGNINEYENGRRGPELTNSVY